MTLVRPIRSQWCGEISLGLGELRAVRRFVHQRHIQTTMRYAHLTPESLDLAVNVLDNEPVTENSGHSLGIGDPMGHFDDIRKTENAPKPEDLGALS